ncbi:hypothetical protein [Paraburkholderia sediminicola]|uniref:hypothetical protein n=1 Tax=Paraburkholderia sediminicola TaxID=458836 RepID=UPI0038BDD72C
MRLMIEWPQTYETSVTDPMQHAFSVPRFSESRLGRQCRRGHSVEIVMSYGNRDLTRPHQLEDELDIAAR